MEIQPDTVCDECRHDGRHDSDATVYLGNANLCHACLVKAAKLLEAEYDYSEEPEGIAFEAEVDERMSMKFEGGCLWALILIFGSLLLFYLSHMRE